MLSVRSDCDYLTINGFNQVCGGQRSPATSCRSHGCSECHINLIKCNEICLVFWWGHAACAQSVAIFPSRHETYPICHIHTSGYDEEFNCAYYYRLLLTMPSRMHAIRRGHLSSPLGVIAEGHMARMTAWKHVNQGGKLLHLCGGVRKMTSKNMGLLLV